MKRQAYSIIVNTHHRQRAPVAERCLRSRLDQEKGSDTCANSIFYMRKRLFGLLPSAGKSARSSSVVWGAVAETRVATQKAIAESRESMAEADAVIARGYRRQAKDLRALVRAAKRKCRVHSRQALGTAPFRRAALPLGERSRLRECEYRQVPWCRSRQ